MKTTRSNKGFTLVEIMIVVLIIGILLAIAVPNFIRARETSRTKTCIANLRQIEAAKEQWAMENQKTGADVATVAELAGATQYIKAFPSCPSTATAYTIAAVNANPTCAIGGLHVLP